MGSEKIGYGMPFRTLNFPSSVKSGDDASNLAIARMSNGSGWDPVVSFNQDGNFLATTSVGPQYDQFAANPHFSVAQIPSNAGLPDLMNGPENLETNGGFGSLSNAKGKRKTIEIHTLRDSAMEIVDDEEKISEPKAVKQAQDKLMAKENYVHMRAKRGQATNSHSLAERFRRERISERMKLLQDLVPGCNKITGKAVMLDEIINYVQSLQQQVELLSMKLATVNSGLNMDLKQTLPNEVLHPQCNDAIILGIEQDLSFPQSFQRLPQVAMNCYASTDPQFHQLGLNLWNNELQSIRTHGLDSMTPNGEYSFQLTPSLLVPPDSYIF